MRALTRRNMLRLTGGLTIATLGSAALASCAPSAPSAPAAQPAEEGAPAPAPAGKTKLVFEWPQYTPEKTRYGEYIINTYMEQNPDIEIEPMYNTNPDEKLIVTIAGGTPPDCGWQGAGWQQFYKNFLVLDEFIERDAAEVQIDDYYEKLLGATTWQGQHQVMAQGFTVTLHYYNKKLFDEAGVDYPTDDWTWDDFKVIGSAISDPDNNIYGSLLDQGSYYAALYINGNFWSEDARQATFYSDMRVHLLQMWKDIWAKDGIGAPPTVTSEQGLMPMFEAGRIGIYAGGSWFLEPARKLEFDWDIVPQPALVWEDGEHRGTGMWTEELFIINTSDKKEEAWQFIKWASGPELLTWAASEGHVVPGRKSIAETEAFLNPNKKPANIHAFLDSAEFAVPVNAHPAAGKVATAIGDPVSAFFSVEETMDAATATRAAHDGIQAALDEWWADQA